MSKPINKDKVLTDIYNGVALLSFGDLVLLQAQVSEHMHNCWQHHQLQREKVKAAGPSDAAYDA